MPLPKEEEQAFNSSLKDTARPKHATVHAIVAFNSSLKDTANHDA